MVNPLLSDNAPKAFLPMVATEAGIVMLANELHLEKALFPIMMTESGMVMLANELHP